MPTNYTHRALFHQRYAFHQKDDLHHGEMPILQDAISSYQNSGDTREELRHVLEDWLTSSIHEKLHVPPLDDIIEAAGHFDLLNKSI